MVKVLWERAREGTEPVHSGGGEKEVKSVGGEIGFVEAASTCIPEYPVIAFIVESLLLLFCSPIEGTLRV